VLFLLFFNHVAEAPARLDGRIGSNADFFLLERFAIFSVKAGSDVNQGGLA
jgi:hypothetical protein